MQSNSIYVGLSGQLTLERRLTTIAHNVANISTAGFRAEGTKFNTITSQKASNNVNFASAGQSYIHTEAGPLISTGNPLDIAVKGNVWLSVQTPQGQVYTRDGRMQMLATGELVSMVGNPVLDPGGQAIVLNPAAGAPQISPDGSIYQDGNQIGAIGLFSIPENAKLTHTGNSGVVADRPVTPVVDNANAGVVQGMYEGSNVNGMTEMTQLITVSRAFEQVTALLNQQENKQVEAIRTLGSRNG